ncbi:TetR/AcrR family transcriptional regulator [Nocardioides sp. GY 10127]|uniref:TetR/AcrR family transcriptional regulator n=1 Tax=Nocardioides sp. GY 10127 TaxID=2569762 RepID=UPI0010A890C1|nr:TetR/AcrR family transcriptional regulator [Nocardioides sp. GY 10127]TIC80144.1 TetR family transcriptional regulator [Nocardioides sp. GY 10127]
MTEATTATGASARDRLREEAFRLFDAQGYESTTVGEIAAAAGVGRTTFFRAFGTKEDVVFPDHDEILARVRARLAAPLSGTTTLSDVTDATGLVLAHYLAEGELARARYRLIRDVPTLRDREAASSLRYQRVFRDALRGWTGEEPGSDLRAELLAASVSTAHNHVLRAWLRSATTGPEVDARARAAFADAMAVVAAGSGPADDPGTTVLVLRTPRDAESVLPALRRALEG